MQVSGELKNKTVDFFRDSVGEYDDKGFTTVLHTWIGYTDSVIYDKVRISYDGNVNYSSLNANIEDSLNNKQEKLIKKKQKECLDLVNIKYAKLNIEKIIDRINKTKRNYTYLLYETLYNLIMKSNSYQSLFDNLDKMEELIFYITTKKDLTQNDMEIMMKLFMEGKEFFLKNVVEYKRKNYHLVYDELDPDVLNIVYYGEMVNPKRISAIAYDLKNYPRESVYVAPIFFTIKDFKKANLWLQLNKSSYFSQELVEENIKKLELPDNYLNLTRRRK